MANEQELVDEIKRAVAELNKHLRNAWTQSGLQVTLVANEHHRSGQLNVPTGYSPVISRVLYDGLSAPKLQP